MLTSPENRAWRIVAFGMLMKLIAVPALIIAGVLSNLELLIFALSLDGAGRLACLCAPIQSRKTIILSVIHQLIAFVFLGVAWTFPVYIGFQIMELIVAAIFQGFSAIQFSRFLVQVAQAINRSDLEERAKRLLLRVNTGTAAGSTVVLYVMMTSPVVFILLIFFCVAPYIVLALILVILLPVVIVLLIRVAPMFYNYVVTLNAFRVGVAELATRQISTDQQDD